MVGSGGEPTWAITKAAAAVKNQFSRLQKVVMDNPYGEWVGDSRWKALPVDSPAW